MERNPKTQPERMTETMPNLQVDLKDLVRAAHADSHYLVSPQARDRLLAQAQALEDLASSARAILVEGGIQQGRQYDSSVGTDLASWQELVIYVEEFAAANDIPLVINDRMSEL